MVTVGVEQTKENVAQLIIFCLGDEEFAVNIDQIKEVVLTGGITPIPDAPDFISGIANVRGKIVIVVDLGKKDGLGRHIIMTEQCNNLFGLLVDEVTEVLRIKETEIKAVPKLVTQIDKDYIKGVLLIEKRLIMLLDLQAILSEEELTKLSKL
jgi:purine-binding chemotaxis protein CheW